jgi:hypothetical protein
MSKMREWLTQELKSQQAWIRGHGGGKRGYVARYGSVNDPEHYGTGGEAIYEADLAQLEKLADRLGIAMGTATAMFEEQYEMEHQGGFCPGTAHPCGYQAKLRASRFEGRFFRVEIRKTMTDHGLGRIVPQWTEVRTPELTLSAAEAIAAALGTVKVVTRLVEVGHEDEQAAADINEATRVEHGPARR